MSLYSMTCPVIFGAGSVSKAGEELVKLGGKKALIVCDSSVEKLDGFEMLKKSLSDAGADFVIYDRVLPDPADYLIDEGARFAKENGIDSIIAFGGGSPIDSAKAIAVLLDREPPINDHFFLNHEHCVPLIAIPTTSGTGSENTNISIITDTKNRAKCPLFCTASLAILDPVLTLTLPAVQTSATAVDAISHAAEAIVTGAGLQNPHSDLLGFKAIKMIVSELPLVLKAPDDLKLRTDMMVAANFAGIAFNDAPVHLGHSVAHLIGAKYHITHGFACAWMTPEVLSWAAQTYPEKVALIGLAMGITFEDGASSLQIGSTVAQAMRDFNRSVGVPTPKESGVSREDLTCLVDETLEACVGRALPAPLDKETAGKILGNLYDLYC